MSYYSGTSGYYYKWWFSSHKKWPYPSTAAPDGRLNMYYPKGVSQAKALGYYSSQFKMVQLNHSFYRLPTPNAVKGWYTKTPDDFRFVAKFSRYATHAKKMANFKDRFDEWWDDRLEHLNEKIIGILIQTGPKFMNTNRKSPLDHKTMLQRIQEAGEYFKSRNLSPDLKVYIEFRHTSWFTEEVYSVLTDVGWNLVCVNTNNENGEFGDLKTGFNPPLETLPVCATDIMFRCHGNWPEAYHGYYSDEELVQMVSFAVSRHPQRSFFVFDNTDSTDGYSTYTDEFGQGKMLVREQEIYMPHAILNAQETQNIITILG